LYKSNYNFILHLAIIYNYDGIKMAIEKDILLSVAKVVCPEYETYEHRGQLSLIIPKESLLDMAFEMRDNPETSFEMLTDITAIDWAKEGDRYEVVYFLYSHKHIDRLRIKVPLNEDDMEVPTLSEVWASANWYERETFDMYGIKFKGHPDLRRFYMPEGFADPDSGEALYPLRKDFPLRGIPDSMPLPPYPERDGEPV
jgi:NADH-quinone oxidoreductase subunit C